MKKVFFLVLLVLTSAAHADGSQKNSIELTDGSRLEGEIVSYSSGVYTIKNSNLGTLKIDESKIRNIRSANATSVSSEKATPSFDPATVQSEVQRLQPVITGNPDIMKLISSLVSNPDFQDILKDPAILNAAKSMDIQALMANEKVVKAINDPTFQEITRQVEEKK